VISRAWFREFRALRSVDIDLERLTVLVGPNGAGKSSVLRGVEWIFADAKTGRLQERLGLLWNQRRWGATGDLSLGVEIPRKSPQSVELRCQATQQYPDMPPRVDGEFQVAGASGEKVSAAQALYYAGSMRDVLDPLLPLFLLRLDAAVMAAPSYSEDKVPLLRADGAWLASVIADLLARAPECVERITEAARRVVPGLRRVRVRRAQVTRYESDIVTIGKDSFRHQREQKYWGHEVVIDTASGSDLPLDVASEGTTLALGLMTFLFGEHPVRTLLLDDLDRGLHPKAQQDLVKVLRGALEARPDLQIVATSHSPYLLDELDFSEVRLTTLADDGTVLCGSLTEHPEYDRWKAHVRPGELWTATLEDWLRRRPARAEP
jgi:predicted ATPase